MWTHDSLLKKIYYGNSRSVQELAKTKGLVKIKVKTSESNLMKVAKFEEFSLGRIDEK